MDVERMEYDRPSRKMAKRKYGYQRRYNNRSNYYNRKGTRLSKITTGLPNNLLTKLTYVDSIKLDNTGSPGIAATQQFRLNSLYDPDYTNTGHQPYLYDQLAALYAHYCVYGVKVEFSVGTETTTSPVLIAVQPTTAISTPSDAELGAERPNSNLLVVDAGGAAQKFSKYYKIADVFGVTKRNILTDDLFQSAITTSPTRIAYLNISAVSQDKAVVCTANFTFKLTFYARFNLRIDQSES